MVKINQFLENIKLAFQGIFSHKLRSFLTMLGIIIGIASIIAIVSTIKGTNEQIKNNLIGSGTNSVTISVYQGDYEYEFSYQDIPDGFTPVSDETLKQINELNNVVSSSRVLRRTYYSNIFNNALNLDGANLYGVDENYFYTVGMQASKGRLFVKDDYDLNRKVVILDRNASNILFVNENPIGKSIEIGSDIYEVIGVVEQRSEFEPNIQNINDYYTYIGNSTGNVYITAKAWGISQRFDEPENVVIKCKSTDAMTLVGKNAASILNNAIGISDVDSTDTSKICYKANDLLEQAKQIQDLSSSTNSMLIWIAGISLIVGGIGVMNIMLVSVTERTREIGLKKALGAKRKRILGQFLTEAAVLTSIGGLFGVIVGIGLAYIIQFVASVPVAISSGAILIAVIFSAVVGIVFGLLPSIKAANLDPIEALRYE